MADVFISYSRSDGAVARRLSKALGDAGSSVWMDEDISGGSEFSDVIEAELNAARKVIVLWSQHSVRSRWVRDEASAAAGQGKLVPVLVDGTQPPMGFRQIQAIDVQAWVKNPGDGLPASLRRAVGIDHGPAPFTPARAQPGARARILAAIVAGVLAIGAVAWLTLSDSGRHSAGGEKQEQLQLVVNRLAGGTDPTDASLASGITDELIVRLRQLPNLQIATAEADGSVPSDAFSAAHVVDGTIRRNGDALRVTARLRDAGGEVVWSETFDRTMADLFDVQESIAAAIANALSVSFDVGTNSTAYGGTDDPRAYAAYMQYIAHSIDADRSVPQSYLERAISLDPDYVKALAGLSSLEGVALSISVSSEAEAKAALARMDSASARAIEAAPDLWIGHVVRGWYEVARKDFSAAERSMRRAAELDPGNDPELRAALAIYAMCVGRVKEGAALRRSNQAIDPIQRNDRWLVFDQMMTGDYAGAVKTYERLDDGQRNMSSFVAHAMMARMLAGDEAGAWAMAENSGLPYRGPFASARAGELNGRSLSQLRDWATSQFGFGGQFAIANRAKAEAYYGHDELAVDLMRVAFERPGGNASFELFHPMMARARKTDAFRQLVEDLGLVRMWRESGNWGDFCEPVGSSFTCS